MHVVDVEAVDARLEVRVGVQGLLGAAPVVAGGPVRDQFAQRAQVGAVAPVGIVAGGGGPAHVGQPGPDAFDARGVDVDAEGLGHLQGFGFSSILGLLNN